eukprot:1135304-Prymnesium_polylepis.1
MCTVGHWPRAHNISLHPSTLMLEGAHAAEVPVAGTMRTGHRAAAHPSHAFCSVRRARRRWCP